MTKSGKIHKNEDELKDPQQGQHRVRDVAASDMSSFSRAAGILLHPTSLPSRGGVGDFGPGRLSLCRFRSHPPARRCGRFCHSGPLGYGNSPYSATSAFAGNPLLISLDRLAERGWIDAAKLDGLAANRRPVEYDQVFAQKMPLLFEAGRNFLRSGSAEALRQFESFCMDNSWWLDDFVLFDGLRPRHKLAPWNEWARESGAS